MYSQRANLHIIYEILVKFPNFTLVFPQKGRDLLKRFSSTKQAAGLPGATKSKLRHSSHLTAEANFLNWHMCVCVKVRGKMNFFLTNIRRTCNLYDFLKYLLPTQITDTNSFNMFFIYFRSQEMRRYYDRCVKRCLYIYLDVEQHEEQ